MSNTIEQAMKRNHARSTIRAALAQLSCMKERLDVLADIQVELGDGSLRVQEPTSPRPTPVRSPGRPRGVPARPSKVVRYHGKPDFFNRAGAVLQAVQNGVQGYYDLYKVGYPEDPPSNRLSTGQYNRISAVIFDLIGRGKVRRSGRAQLAVIPQPIQASDVVGDVNYPKGPPDDTGRSISRGESPPSGTGSALGAGFGR